MRFTWLLACLALMFSVACSSSSYEMPRTSLAEPELVPEIALVPGVEHRVSKADRDGDKRLPLAVADDPKLIEFEEDPETGDLFAIGLKPGRTLIRHPREKGDMATKIRIDPPYLNFPGRNDIPRYLRGHCNPATFAHAVNHYVRMGEARACRELMAVSELAHSTDDLLLWDLDYRINLLCRVLFEGSPTKPLRGALLGASVVLPHRSMRAGNWPLLPLAEQDGVYLDMGCGSFILGGVPEPIADYLRYCRKEGRFRSTPVRLPGRKLAIAAAKALPESKRWANLREKARLNDENFNEGFLRHELLTQARSIYPLSVSK